MPVTQNSAVQPTVAQVYEFMQTLAPLELAQSWDNPGLLVNAGSGAARILCALDITAAVVQEAKEKQCTLIVSHHPVIFNGIKKLCAQDVVFQLAQNGISAVCMHTNLDAATGGVNDVLAQVLGVVDAQPYAEDGIGRIGTLDTPMTAAQLAQRCAARLHGAVRLAGDGERLVRRVALLGGSGGNEWPQAVAAGADAYITGDAGHHNALDATAAGMCLLAAGHYETEVPIVPIFAAALAAQFPAAEVLCAQSAHSPFSTVL